LALSVVGVLVATFLFSIAVAQAGSGSDLDVPARSGVQEWGYLPAHKRVDLPVQTGPAASSATPSRASATSVWTIPSPAYKIYITADGIYELDYSYLATRLPVDTLDPRTLRMFYMGQEIAIRVIGEEDGRFDTGDAVVFYARSVDAMYFEGLTPINQYTGTNVYWLAYGGLAGLRMTVQDGSGPGAPPRPVPTCGATGIQPRQVQRRALLLL
jgi:hypothetical protein